MLSLYWVGLKKLFRIGKIVFFVVAVYLMIIGLFSYFTNKDTSSKTSNVVEQNRQEVYKTINDPVLKKSQDGRLKLALYRSTFCLLLGQACTNNSSDDKKNFSRSLSGVITNVLSSPYQHPPASGIAFVAESLTNAHLLPQSYAAYKGIGLSSIQPLAQIWDAFRNVSYIILVLFIVTIGFMIMFRMKINPQTVISVENSLPSIVITLILITFSFAIAGLMIDLMYLSIAVVVSILAKAGGLDPVGLTASYMQAQPQDLIGKLSGSSGFLGDIWNLTKIPLAMADLLGSVVSTIFTGVATTIIFLTLTFPFVTTNITKNFFDNLIPEADAQPGGIGLTFQIFKAFGNPVGVMVSAALALALAPLLFWAILFLLFFLTVLFLFFRIVFMIITSYIKIILLIIFAPVFLLFNAIPGKSVFGTWIKNLIAELLIFPLLVIIFVTGSILINLTSKGAYFTPPFMAGINASSFSFLLGMGLLFMTPDLIKTAKQLILPKPLPVPDVGLGVFFGGASAGLTGGIGEVSKWASLGYYVKPLGALMAKATGGLVDPTGQQRGATAPGTNNPCLSVNTFINTPSGPSLITKLKMGDVVWTRDLFGKKRESFILSVVRTSVPRNHMIAKLYLTDGRKLFVSPHHPLIDKRDVADLKKGDHYDGSVVRLIRIMRYNHRYTYDILPSGSTGIYLANDIALGSTLFNRDFKGLRKSLRIAEYLSTSYHYFKKAILVE